MVQRSSRPSGVEGIIPSFAFIGPFAVGKTTYSDRLKALIEAEFGIKVYRPSFSAKMEDIARDLFGMKEYDRSLMQAIANKMREIDPAVWARYIIGDVMTHGRLPIIVDGVRKPEELNTLQEEIPNLVVIKLTADESQLLEAYKKKFGHYPTAEQQSNPAESSIPLLHYDLALHNNYTKEELDRQLTGIVDAIRNNTLEKMLVHKD